MNDEQAEKLRQYLIIALNEGHDDPVGFALQRLLEDQNPEWRKMWSKPFHRPEYL